MVLRNLGLKLENFLYNGPAEVPFANRRKLTPGSGQLKSCVALRKSLAELAHCQTHHDSANISPGLLPHGVAASE